jgi:hypothetical protein
MWPAKQGQERGAHLGLVVGKSGTRLDGTATVRTQAKDTHTPITTGGGDEVVAATKGGRPAHVVYHVLVARQRLYRLPLAPVRIQSVDLSEPDPMHMYVRVCAHAPG